MSELRKCLKFFCEKVDALEESLCKKEEESKQLKKSEENAPKVQKKGGLQEVKNKPESWKELKEENATLDRSELKSQIDFVYDKDEEDSESSTVSNGLLN